jgi:serine/threonine protein kinase
VHQFTGDHRRKGGRVVTAGYSPVEQYYQGGYVGPWSDVYAIGASIRACIEARTPITAIERHSADTMVPALEAFVDRYPRYLLECIDWSMDLDPQQRPQSAGELLAVLKRKSGRSTASVPGGLPGLQRA